jgi:hypothetical protein
MHTTPAIISRAVVMALSKPDLHFFFGSDACGYRPYRPQLREAGSTHYRPRFGVGLRRDPTPRVTLLFVDPSAGS